MRIAGKTFLVPFTFIFFIAVIALAEASDGRTQDSKKCTAKDGDACLREAYRGWVLDDFHYMFDSASLGCESGNQASCGVAAPNQTKSFRFLNTECKKGSPIACYFQANLGTKEEKHNLTSDPGKLANGIFQANCKSGDPFACAAIGILLYSEGIDPSQGKQLLEKACTEGEPLACILFGRIAISTSKPEAKTYFEKGCNLGSFRACKKFAILSGDLGDQAGATKILASLCDSGDAESCGFEASFLEKKGDRAGAKRLYQTSCEKGATASCVDFGLMEKEDGNLPSAKSFFGIACQKHKVEGCRFLGELENELGNTKEGSRLLKKACEERDEGSCLLLAQSEFQLNHNKAGMVYAQKARSIINKKCDGGNRDACAKLKSLASIGVKSE